MLDAMTVTDKKEKFIKLFYYLGPIRKVLKKLEQNGVLLIKTMIRH